MHKLQQEQYQKRKHRNLCLLVAIFLVLGVTAVIRVILANRLVESAATLRELEIRAAAIREDNQKIRDELLSVSSLHNLEAQAWQAGYVSPDSISYVVTPPPLAAKLP